MAERLKAKYGTGLEKCECRSRFNSPCCANLLPVQAWALTEAEMYGGIVGPIGVGHGKTLLDLLTPMVVTVERCVVLLLPANLKTQLLERDWAFYGQHWKLPNLAGGKFFYPGRPTLHVVAYSELSGARSAELLKKLNPDVIIADEAHNLRNKDAARAKRFFRHLNETHGVKLFCWSGTLTSKGLADWATLSSHALADASPAPRFYPTIEEWSGFLDPAPFRRPPGKLKQAFGEDTIAGYQKRVVESPGVISSGDVASCQASLEINERRVETPEIIKKHLKELDASWDRPDGDPLVDAMSVARCARELSAGFYYRWKWPRKEPKEVIEKWLEVRKKWHKELREKLKTSKSMMDSPLLLTKAAIRWYDGYTHVSHEEREYKDEEGNTRVGVFEKDRTLFPPYTKDGPLPVWASEHWQEWRAVRDTAQPETDPVWLDTFLAEDAARWLQEGPGLCWYEHQAFAAKVLEFAPGAVFAGPGASGNDLVLKLKGDEACCISIKAHGTGKNLQRFNRNLVANPPGAGDIWEQLLGRTHRAGQESDAVTVDVYRHTDSFRNAVERARDLSEYIQGAFGATQRLASVAHWGF